MVADVLIQIRREITYILKKKKKIRRLKKNDLEIKTVVNFEKTKYRKYPRNQNRKNKNWKRKEKSKKCESQRISPGGLTSKQ